MGVITLMISSAVIIALLYLAINRSSQFGQVARGAVTAEGQLVRGLAG